MKEKKIQLYNDLLEKTNNGLDVPTIDKNGIKVHALTIFEDIMLRNINNLQTIALEINNTKMTYHEFFLEVEKYIKAFKIMGYKEGDVVSICLPVGIEYICLYFALTTLGITCNTLNIMFLLDEGIGSYVDKRCSDTIVCSDDFYHALLSKNAFSDSSLKRVILTNDNVYNQQYSNEQKISVKQTLPGVDIIDMFSILKLGTDKDIIKATGYDENRFSTLTYTSGTTGRPKCMAHSDLAPLFLIASHDHIITDEKAGDRTLVTIPFQHPTGLFYAMVYQLAQGKTLVLQPIYDKRLFVSDIKEKKINHSVQAKPYYAQLIQDCIDGRIKPGDFKNYRHPYSGGEGFPMSVCKAVNEVLAYGGCKSPLLVGYGRSEEGSSTTIAYNIDGRLNTVGRPLPGIKAKLVDPKTLEDLEIKPGVVGEILISTPVHPLYHCYLGDNNKPGKPDESIVDLNGVRWARPEDIAIVVECNDGVYSYLVLGRANDKAIKNNEEIYLFNLKENISNIKGVQECEVLKISNNENDNITVHLVINSNDILEKTYIMKEIYNLYPFIDGIKFYDSFAINATSGKCDKVLMQNDWSNYFTYENGEIVSIDFEKEEDKVLKRIKK